MTVRTAVTIYFNPDDISIVVGELTDNKGKFGLGITRGPRNERHPFQILLTSENTAFNSKEEAIAQIEELLKQCIEYGDKVFTDPEFDILKAVCSKGWETKEEYIKNSAPVLETGDIERIIAELHEKEVASPYEWKEWKERYPGGVLT